MTRGDDERRRRRAAYFGDDDESTADDREPDGTAVEPLSDRWLRDQVPPHHG